MLRAFRISVMSNTFVLAIDFCEIYYVEADAIKDPITFYDNYDSGVFELKSSVKRCHAILRFEYSITMILKIEEITQYKICLDCKVISMVFTIFILPTMFHYLLTT
jgi:hypothetical protein